MILALKEELDNIRQVIALMEKGVIPSVKKYTLENRITELEKQIETENCKNVGLNRYVVFDGNSGMFGDDIIVYAKNTKEAVEKLMKQKGIVGNIKRSGSNCVRFGVTKTRIRNGKVYKIGREVWYEHKKGE